MADACRLWDRSHSISGREIEGDTSTKSLVGIMSTMDL